VVFPWRSIFVRQNTQPVEKSNIKKGNDIMVDTIITEEERTYLLNNMKDLLDEYNYVYTEFGLNRILNTWSRNKADLITAFKKHPSYVEGKFMIAFSTDYEREIDVTAVGNFKSWLLYEPVIFLRDNVPEEIRRQTLVNGCAYLPHKLYSFLADLDKVTTREISVEIANTLNEILPDIHAHAGQKTSRVINKICTYLGYNKHPNYNREYAKYADALSPMTIKRHTVLSINPLDYLTMSFGNSWASCHTIDKTNKRGMPNNYSGCYSSGTISYMLDFASMVFYTVNAAANGDELWNEPKIHRQMFHYENDKLIQGRLYPQDNDGSQGDALYSSYRQIVQQIISTIFEVPNLWVLRKGIDAVCEYVDSKGTHYRDYVNYNNCTLSTIKGTDNTLYVNVGHDPICIECGEEHDIEDNIDCCHNGYSCCADCGVRIVDEDDEYYVNGEVYCRDCVSYCDYCEEYHRQDSHWIDNENIYVCEYCYNEYFTCCDNCGNDVRREDVTEIDGEWICESCLDQYYTRCDECGAYVLDTEIHRHEDDYLCEDCYTARTEDETEAC
jgi:hypothetical protein